MKKILNISGIVSGLAVLVGIGIYAQQIEERIPPKDVTDEAVTFFRNYDEKKAYGEYIIDSIEEVNTQRWRTEQRQFNNMVLEYLQKQDSLTRLNVRQTYEIKQKQDN